MTASPTTRRPLAVALAALGVSSLVAACQEPLEIRYETQHLRIGTSFDEPLCRGDLDHLELVITTAETALATNLSKPVDIYLWSQPEWDASVVCPVDHALGCFENGTIYTSLHSADHELIHSVMDTAGDPAPFWEEGTAVAFSGRVRFGPSTPADHMELVQPELGYATSGAFARWLFETHGPELYQELVRHPGSGREAFESVYGMSAEEAQDDYFETSFYSYGAMVACEHAELTKLGPREWGETIEIDCDSKYVWGGPFGMRSHRVMEIEERGYYSFSTTAESLTIARCQDVDLEEPPILDDPAMGEVPFATPAFPEYFVRFSGSDGPVSYDLAPGRYEVVAGQSDYETRTHEVSVIADTGPVPQTPESTL